MADILDYLKQIANSIYGKDVRSSIVNAIRQCYDDGKAGATDLLARERISNLAKLAEGSTTGDAELVDLRVGADGKTYPNAGDAVRGQISELKSDLVNISNQDYFSLADKTNGKYVNENGVISDYEYFGVTDYIKIPPLMNSVTFLNRVTLGGEQYPLNNYEFAIYDANKSWLETIRGDKTVGYITRGIENENARYIRLNYGIHDIDDCVCIFNRIDYIKNKIKWYGFGDSITEGYGGNYFDIASKIINADYYNFGVGATGYLDNSGGSVAYQQLSNKDYFNVDLITLSWGINDYRSSKPLGDINDNHSSNTICGELNACIELLGLHAKDSTVVIMTPLNISEVGTFGSNYAYDTNNSANYSLNDLSDKLIAIANKYNLLYIDMRKEVGFTRYNLQNLLLSDGVHPNEKGVKKIGMLLGTKLNVRGWN